MHIEKNKKKKQQQQQTHDMQTIAREKQNVCYRPHIIEQTGT